MFFSGNINKVIEKLSMPEQDYSDNGKCSRCGECCTNILPLTKKELQIIKNFIKKNNIKPIKSNALFNNYVNLVCPFADKVNKKCLIYSVRPIICREYACYNKKEPDKLIKKYKEPAQIINMNKEF